MTLLELYTMTPCLVSHVFSVSPLSWIRERCQVATHSWQDAVNKTSQLALLSARPLVVRNRCVNRDSAPRNLASRMSFNILVTTAVKRTLDPRPNLLNAPKYGVTWLQHQRQYIDSAFECTCVDAVRMKVWRHWEGAVARFH